MDGDTILAGVSIIIKLVFGVGGVIGWIAGIYFKRTADRLHANLERETETHKMRLRKSELIFQKRFEAANSLNDILYTIYRSAGLHVGDQLEFRERISEDFQPLHEHLESYLRCHFVILPTDVAKRLETAEGIAYEFRTPLPENANPDVRAEAVGKIVDAIQESIKELQREVIASTTV